MKKNLAKFAFIMTMVLGLAFSVSAQDQKKKEPKRPKPPKIIVPKKSKKDKKKKPDNFSMFAAIKSRDILS